MRLIPRYKKNEIENESIVYFNQLENPNDLFPHPGFYRDGVVYGVHIYRDGISFDKLKENVIRIEKPNSRVYCG